MIENTKDLNLTYNSLYFDVAYLFDSQWHALKILPLRQFSGSTTSIGNLTITRTQATTVVIRAPIANGLEI